MKINKKYYLYFEEINDFKFGRVNDIVDVGPYENKIMPEIPRIASLLNKDNNTRQAVIIISDGIRNAEMNSCLISMQFQIAEQLTRKTECKKSFISVNFETETYLYVTCNFRSQCEVNGQPNDSKMINYIITCVKKLLNIKINNILTEINVGNYHINTTSGKMSNLNK